MDLIIAEKPSLAADIARALDPQARNRGTHWEAGGYSIAPCVGHLLGLVEFGDYDAAWQSWSLDHLPIIPNAFRKKLLPGAKSRFDVIRQLSGQAKRIVHAGDPDREGALIVDEVLAACGIRPSDPRVLRLWLHAQTPQGIRDAMRALQPNAGYATLSASAEARARADQVIGFNMTRGLTLLWREKGHEGVLHVGRVKTPTLCLVVERELAIQDFKPHTFYGPTILVDHHNGSFKAKWVRPDGVGESDDEGRLIEAAVADAVVARVDGRSGTIASVQSEEKRQAAPLLLSLSDLQKAAGAFGLTPQKTLDAAQSLYDKHKVLTYPRTSCSYAPSSYWSNAAALTAALEATFGSAWPYGQITPSFKLKSRAFDDSKLAEHFAIVPTGQSVDWSALTVAEQTVMKIVARHWIAQFLPAYRYKATTVTVEVGEDAFRATGTVPIEMGWREAFGKTEDEKEDPLPAMDEGDECVVAQADRGEAQTRPPARFTPATLLEAMRDAHKYVKREDYRARLKGVEGIGTEATRAAIIEAIESDGYVSSAKEGKRTVLVPTSKALAYYRAMPHELRNVDLTAYFEGKLAEVAEGKVKLDEFMEFQRRFTEFLVKKVKDGSILAQLPTPADMPAAPVVAKGRAGRGKSVRKRTATA